MSLPFPALTRPSKTRRRYRLGLVFILLFVLSVGWFCFRTVYFGSGIFLSFSQDAKSGTISFFVHDRHGSPLAGVPVNSQSHSGNAGCVITDSDGRATITPSASEVLAVYVDDRWFRLRPTDLIETFFSPKCSPSGLAFDVTLYK